jgi:competence ComEA-like helix-hairpin-helix protein
MMKHDAVRITFTHMRTLSAMVACLPGVIILARLVCPVAAQDDQEAKDRQAENRKIAAELPDGEGKSILVARCEDCHSLARITSGRKSLVSWRNTIKVMGANGAIFEDKEIEPLAQYLAANFALPVNVNSATASELSSIPGLDPESASAIIDYREKNGRFTTVQDLAKVKGVTPDLLKKIEGRITAGIAPH